MRPPRPWRRGARPGPRGGQAVAEKVHDFGARVAEHRFEGRAGVLQDPVGSDDDHDVTGTGDEGGEAPFGSAQIGLERLARPAAARPRSTITSSAPRRPSPATPCTTGSWMIVGARWRAMAS